MGYCGNTFRKVQTSHATIAEKFKRLPMHSTTGPANHSGGEHRRKCLPTNYTQAHDTVLRRPVESAQYTAIHYSETLMLEGLIPSIGTVGDALDNGLCETTIGLYKTECVREGSPFRTGPIRTLTDLENSTSAWVAWYNERRLMHRLWRRPPAEAEAEYYARLHAGKHTGHT